jgi:hypothetical protein
MGEANEIYDMFGNVIEISTACGIVSLSLWKVSEDSQGWPCQGGATDPLRLPSHKAIELARRLLNAATK